jgi:hypothetical protein
MAFSRLMLTTDGKTLYAKAQQGKTLQFTRVGIGDGNIGSGSLVNRTALIDQKLSLFIDTIQLASETESAIITTLKNENLAEGFYFREIGIFAKDPDTQQEKLYLYDNAGTDGEYIPDNQSGVSVNERLKFLLLLENVATVSFVPSGNPIYLAVDDIDDTAFGTNTLWSSEKTKTEIVDAISKGVPHLGTTTNIGNNYSITYTEAIPADKKFSVTFNAAASGVATLKISSIGNAKPLVKPGGGDFKPKAGTYNLFYNGTNFQCLGEGGDYGTAGPAQTLEGFTVGTEDGIKDGTISNKGPASAETINLTTEGAEYTIAAGFHSGLRKIKAVITGLVAGVVKSGVIVGGIEGTFTNDATATAAQMLKDAKAWVKGILVTGNIPVRGSEEYTGWRRATIFTDGPIPGRVHLSIPLGAYLTGRDDGAAGITMGIFCDDANFVPENFRADKEVLGQQGGIPVIASESLNNSIGVSYWPIGQNGITQPRVWHKAQSGMIDTTGAWFYSDEPDMRPENFKAGKTAFQGQLVGSYVAYSVGDRFKANQLGAPIVEKKWEFTHVLVQNTTGMHQVAVDDGNFVYCASGWAPDNKIYLWKLNKGDGSLVWSVNIHSSYCNGLFLGKDKNIYSTSSDGYTKRIDPNGNITLTISSGGGSGVCADASGNIYVSLYDGKVVSYNSSGVERWREGVSQAYYDIDIDYVNGYVYAVTNSSTVSKIRLDGYVIYNTNPGITLNSQPHVAVSDNGLYVWISNGDTSSGAVALINTGTGTVSWSAGILYGVSAIDVDEFGNAYYQVRKNSPSNAYYLAKRTKDGYLVWEKYHHDFGSGNKDIINLAVCNDGFIYTAARDFYTRKWSDEYSLIS